jgi:uncharacterized protein (TIGR04255 family)
MRFPESPRVVFRKSPLVEVTVQLRFPPILRILAQSPAEFQDAIRDEYPLYEVEAPTPKPSITTTGGQQFTMNVTATPNRIHVFYSTDRTRAHKLANHELAVITKQYERWESFRSQVMRGCDALVKAYQPAFFSHVCVRYRNVIQRSVLGLTDMPWSDLINPTVIGPLGVDGFNGSVEKHENKFTLLLDDIGGRIDASIGLGTNPQVKEKAVIIDSHVYIDGQTRIEHAGQNLDQLHRVAGLFFRWCVRRPLLDALEPTGVGDE